MDMLAFNMAIALIGVAANVVLVPEGLQEALTTKIPTAKLHIVAVDAIIAIQIMVSFLMERKLFYVDVAEGKRFKAVFYFWTCIIGSYLCMTYTQQSIISALMSLGIVESLYHLLVTLFVFLVARLAFLHYEIELTCGRLRSWFVQ
jgi:hypothetical protein